MTSAARQPSDRTPAHEAGSAGDRAGTAGELQPLRLLASREHALLALVELTGRLWRSEDVYATADALLLNVMGQAGTARAALWLRSDNDMGLPVLIRCHGFHPGDATALATACWGPLLEHFGRDPALLPAERAPSTLEHALQSLARRSRVALFAPVRAEREVLGVVALGGRAGRRRYEPFDLEVLQASFAVAGAAMRNSHVKGAMAESNRRLTAANERLRELDRLKSQFIQNVNHELRTPLTIVIGCLSCLEMPGIADEVRRPLIESATGSAGKLLHLIEELLTFSNADRGTLPVEAAAGDVATFIAGYHAGRRPGVSAGLRQLHAVPGVGRLRARFDPQHLREILDELVDNALRFTPQGSNIWIEVRDHAEHGSAWVRIDVRDDGYGFPADQVATMFQTFRQADGSATRQVGGLGMGLPVARRVAEAMGGRLEGTSEPGRGSTFSILLPAAGPA